MEGQFFLFFSIIIVVETVGIMSSQVNVTTNTPKKPFSSFKSVVYAKKVNLTYAPKRSYRNHNRDVVETHTKVKALLGSVAGVGLSTAVMAKQQKLSLKNPLNLFKLKYGVKEMIAVCGLGIISGALAGMIGSDKKKEKMDEGVFQFMNATVPLLGVHPVTKMIDNSKYKENLPLRVAAIVAVLFAGMKVAAEFSNFINDPHDKVPDRKLTMLDSIANIDDAVGAFAIAKIPVVSQLEKILPLIYVWCGYRAGKNN